MKLQDKSFFWDQTGRFGSQRLRLYETPQPEVTIQGLRMGTPMCVPFWGEADT